MQSYDPVKAHLPSGVRATEFIQPVCPERTEDYYQDLKDPRVVQWYLEIQLRPTYHLVSELLSLSSRYALKEHEDYYQDLKDPRGVQCYLEIQLMPTYHLV